MSNFLAGPADDSDEDPPQQPRSDERSRRSASNRARQTPIPGTEECLRAMSVLAGLVAMGLIRPGQANAIRALSPRFSTTTSGLKDDRINEGPRMRLSSTRSGRIRRS